MNLNQTNVCIKITWLIHLVTQNSYATWTLPDEDSSYFKYINVVIWTWYVPPSIQWRHNGRDSVWNHQPHGCLLSRLFRRRSKKTSKLRVTGLCAGNSPGTGEIPAQMVSNAENVSIWRRHHVEEAWHHFSQMGNGDMHSSNGQNVVNTAGMCLKFCMINISYISNLNSLYIQLIWLYSITITPAHNENIFIGGKGNPIGWKCISNFEFRYCRNTF